MDSHLERQCVMLAGALFEHKGLDFTSALLKVRADSSQLASKTSSPFAMGWVCRWGQSVESWPASGANGPTHRLSCLCPDRAGVSDMFCSSRKPPLVVCVCVCVWLHATVNVRALQKSCFAIDMDRSVPQLGEETTPIVMLRHLSNKLTAHPSFSGDRHADLFSASPLA